MNPSRRGPRSARWAVTGLLLAGFPLAALDPADTIAQYSHRSWSREGGQFSATVRALAQTSDGNLWIGTDSGLLRFDGVRFTRWRRVNDQLASDYIVALAADRDGSLWIGTRAGLSHYKNGGIRNYSTSTSPVGPGVTAILVDAGGVVWAGTAGRQSGGLCRVEGNGLKCYGAADWLASSGVLSLLEDRGGRLWVGGLGLRQWTPGAPPTAGLLGARDAISSMAQDPEGGIWAAGHRLERVRDGRFLPYAGLAAEQWQPNVLLTDRHGGLWIGTRADGLLRLYHGQLDRFTRRDGLSNDIVRSLLEDREGNVWAGTEGGLDRFREFAVTTIGKREGLSQNIAATVYATRRGGVWVGTLDGLDRVDGRRVERYDKRDGLPSSNITGIFERQDGGVWAFTAAGPAYSSGGRFHPVRLPFGAGSFLAAAAEDRDHSVWLSAGGSGLLRMQGTRVAEMVPWSRFGGKLAWALEPDPGGGGLWLGFAQGGVAYYRDGQPIRWFATPARPGRAAITDLHQARDGALWIASEGGLGRLQNGHLTTMTTASGLPCDRFFSLVEDDRGDLWLNSACGLVHLSGAELSAWRGNPARKVRARVYDAGDGMRVQPALTGYFRRAAKSADGRIWFPVLDGVAVADPNHLPDNRLAPPVQIDGIFAGRREYAARPGLRLPPASQEIRIEYSALSLVAPEKVRFRSRLEGFDREWSDAAGSRQAVYTNLPPRHYRFRVIASNNDGIWNQTGASFDFWVLPTYYQTNWFRILCGCAAGLLMWSLHRLRVRQIEAGLHMRYQERLAERTRIAREMHDTLIQDICGFALQVNGLAKTAGLPAQVRERMQDIRREAEQCLREAREFVWELRAPTLEERDLPEALCQAGEQIIQGAEMRFRIQVIGERRPASPTVQHDLVRIFQEAARNAVRYSRAQEIEMQVMYLDTPSVRVRMRDDGCGFDPDAASRKLGHWGLKTMRERAERIGGELKIQSAPGQGTEIEVTAPMPAAGG